MLSGRFFSIHFRMFSQKGLWNEKLIILSSGVVTGPCRWETELPFMLLEKARVLIVDPVELLTSKLDPPHHAPREGSRNRFLTLSTPARDPPPRSSRGPELPIPHAEHATSNSPTTPREGSSSPSLTLNTPARATPPRSSREPETPIHPFELAGSSSSSTLLECLSLI